MQLKQMNITDLCSVSGGACMYLYPDSKRCAREYGEGPDVGNTEDMEE